MIELMKQVGELGKNVMMFEKYYLAKWMDNPNFQHWLTLNCYKSESYAQIVSQKLLVYTGDNIFNHI